MKIEVLLIDFLKIVRIWQYGKDQYTHDRTHDCFCFLIFGNTVKWYQWYNQIRCAFIGLMKKFILLGVILYFFGNKINKSLREVGRTCCFNFVHSSGSDYVLLVLALVIGSIRYWNSTIGYFWVYILLHLWPYVGSLDCLELW